MLKMLTKIKMMALSIAVLCAATTMMQAQSTTQGGIAGTVFDSTGAVIANATVLIHNDGTNAEKTVKTDEGGYFNLPLVEPGTYTVTISAAGFGSEVEKDVTVQVGQQTAISPKLSSGKTEVAVTVTAEASTLNFENPDIASELPRTAIDDIPIQIRRWSALALTTPGVTADNYGFGLISVRAMSTLLNNVEIDGADDNQAYYSEERGRTRAQYSTSPNAVQEFQVNTGVYSTQYGRALGAVINSITRSGSNEFHGEAVFTDLDRGFGADVPGVTNLSGVPFKMKDLKKIYGGTLGGYLIKNKLFFEYTYDQVTHINDGYGKPKSAGLLNGSVVGSFLELPDASVTSCNLTTGATVATGEVHATLDAQVCSLAARGGLSSYALGVSAYESGLTSIESDLGTVSRKGYQEINTPKIDWQINSKERASFLYHRLRWDAPGYVQTAAGPLNYGLDAWGNDGVKLDYGVTKLETLVSSHISNELLYQYGRELNYVGQQPYSAYTLNNLVSPGTNGSGVVNGPGGTIPYITLNAGSTGFYLGSPYYSYRQALPDERKWQIEDTLYWSLGNHSLSMGGDFVHNTDLTHQEPYYFGYYNYSNLTNLLSDEFSKGKAGTCGSTTAGSGVGTSDCYTSFTQDFGATAFSVATMDYAGFVQDNWKVSSRLTLELGLRYDFEMLPNPLPSLTVATSAFTPYPGLNNHPEDRNNFGPRIGFTLDPYGDGKTVIRGGFGLYYGRIVNSSVLSVLTSTGSAAGQYALGSSLKPFATGAPIFPAPIAGGSAAATPSSMFLAPNLQNPAADEFDLNVQRELGKGTAFQISYLGSLGRTLPNFLNVNLAAPTVTSTITVGAPTVAGFGNGPLPVGSTYSVPQFSSTYINPKFGNISELISNITSNYNALVVEIQNRSMHNLTFDANYTWSHALDYNQNATSTASGSSNSWLNPYAAARQNYGVSQFNIGNRFVGWVLYKFPNVAEESRLKYVANGWSINDSFQMQNGLPYSAQINTGSSSSIASNSGTWNGINGVYYLPPVGLNTFQVPRAIVDDLRLQKSFKLERYELQLIADMYNVANHQNYSTNDMNESAYNFGTTGTLNYIPNSAPGIGFGSHSATNDSGFLYTPREFQIGARLEF
jgi:hypothetical protein